MNESAKVGVAVAGGYLLGRTKKAKLAITLGTWLLGKRLDLDPKELGKGALSQLAKRPEVAKLTGDVRGELMQAGRAAATAAMNSRLERLAEGLEARTERLRNRKSSQDDESDEDYAEDEYDDAEDYEDEDYDDESEDDDGADELPASVTAPVGRHRRRAAARPAGPPIHEG
jgi:hypothetical protein